jgi:hypothetical protein
MTTATTISTMQREPTLLGQTVVLIGGSAGSGQRETPATASIRQGTLRPTRPGNVTQSRHGHCPKRYLLHCAFEGAPSPRAGPQAHLEASDPVVPDPSTSRPTLRTAGLPEVVVADGRR